MSEYDWSGELTEPDERELQHGTVNYARESGPSGSLPVASHTERRSRISGKPGSQNPLPLHRRLLKEVIDSERQTEGAEPRPGSGARARGHRRSRVRRAKTDRSNAQSRPVPRPTPTLFGRLDNAVQTTVVPPRRGTGRAVASKSYPSTRRPETMVVLEESTNRPTLIPNEFARRPMPPKGRKESGKSTELEDSIVSLSYADFVVNLSGLD